MKLTILLLTTVLFSVCSKGVAQNITFSCKSCSLEFVFNAIEKQLGYVTFTNEQILTGTKPVTVSVRNIPLRQLLDQVLKNQPVTYTLQNKMIVLSRKSSSSKKTIDSDEAGDVVAGTIKIQVLDSLGSPLAGATVSAKNRKHLGITNADGICNISANEGDVITVSYVGYEPRTITITQAALRNAGVAVTLQAAVAKLNEVVVNTGMFNRRKEKFTGATSTFNGDELRRVGNQNVLQSLKTLDPSFIIRENNFIGSDPNQLPKIELRGKTSINPSGQNLQDQFATDPNQPLFILDGMETTLRQIVDLDINRVGSVTILKDAASTALYGSKAANGVVVIETIRPKPGELRISYVANANASFPDLRSYNMMDAAEHLEFQRLSGMYNESPYASGFNNSDLYNKRLMEVAKGVNSYWLNTPLRNVLNVGHSLNISGGDSRVVYGIGLNYKNDKGVMIGSGRKTWGGNLFLNYRKGKINVSNQLYINGSESDVSPYGDFTQYVQLSPYYRKKDAQGNLNTNRYLEEYDHMNTYGSFPDKYRITNPLYNATLNSINQTKDITITNNLNFIWDMFSDIRLTGGFQINKTTGNSTYYIPALNTKFDDVTIYEKGSLTDGRTDNKGYQANVAVTYNKVIQNAHSLNFNIRGSIQNTEFTSLQSVFVGFPEGVEGIPSFAFSYAPNAKPQYSNRINRNISLLGSLNYSYNGKYNLDATYNLDGSNSFGSDYLYTPFWSVGLGWNIHQEKAFRNVHWIDLLRLRGNVGINGNQGFGRFLSTTTYLYESGSGMFGQGLNIRELGNPQLQWQKTTQTSLGVDLGMFQRKMLVTLNLYRKLTDPLTVPVSLPTSTGLPSFSDNVGSLETRGIELNLQYSPVYNLSNNVIWTLGVTGSVVKGKYEGLSALLQNFNKAAQESNSLLRYYDGYSPDDIWAVRSLGIDPLTGTEIFLSKNDEYTNTYSATDIVRVGNSQPKLQGVVSSNLSVKGFRVGIYLRYKLGASALNTALYDKVENISFNDLQNNQDRRALYSRWKKPGDISAFRSISITDNTPMSSRFIQKENLLSGESINVSYSFLKEKWSWMRYAGLRELRLAVTMNDIFQLTNVQIERGIQYPFARNITFTLNTYF